MLIRRRPFFTALAVVLPLLFGACGDDKEPSGSASVAGTYTLRTVNGASLPFLLFQDDAEKFEVTAGSATLNADGTYIESVTMRVTEGTAVTNETSGSIGTWVRSGGTITLTDGDGDRETATLSGNALIMSVDLGTGSMSLRYTK